MKGWAFGPEEPTQNEGLKPAVPQWDSAGADDSGRREAASDEGAGAARAGPMSC